MSTNTDRDESQWRAVRYSLAQDPEGRKILSALDSDPEAGDGGVPAIRNELSNAEIQKLVNFARADHVYVGDRNTYLDHSRHYLDLELNPMARARPFPRFLMVTGTLVFLGGFATSLYGMFQLFQQANGSFGSSPGLAPPIAGFPSELFVGFGICFAGAALSILGNLFKPKESRRGRD